MEILGCISYIDFIKRNDKVINKAYLEGKYGAIPQFPILNIDEL